jgi:ferritin-like metal-binding protein YciE
MAAQPADTRVIRYLNEAQATEQALIQTLQAHILMTPGGRYRELLEGHLDETREHSRLISERVLESISGRSLLGTGVWFAEFGLGVAQSVAGRLIATSKAPIDMLRGLSREEKLLKNAKDEYASEALEIATYEALEEVAGQVGDARTAELARRIRVDEERMLRRLHEEIKVLAARAAGGEAASRRTSRPEGTRPRRPGPEGSQGRARRRPAGESSGGRRTSGTRARSPRKAADSDAGESPAE